MKNRTDGWWMWGGLTLNGGCLDMLWPNEVALLVFLAGATLAEACSMDRLDGLRRARPLALGLLGLVWLWAAE